ncbi:MAG: hypothetical protein JWN01_845 [Patescibacteria group bacterium]|nr:hypothetical protein [Patescibacteria group bacterium]
MARRKNNSETFRERLGNEDIQMDDFKVDDLRKIASEYDISGSHDMNKQELVETINRVRRSNKS